MKAMKVTLRLFILCLLFVQPVRASLFSDLKISNKDGKFKLSGVEFNIVHVNENWKRSTLDRSFQSDSGFPTKSEQVIEDHGTFNTASGSYALVKQLQAKGDRIQFHAGLEGVPTGKTKRLFLEARLSSKDFEGTELIINGSGFLLPEAVGQAKLFDQNGVESCVIKTDAGAIQITGAFKLAIQDDRAINTSFKHYSLMFFFNPHEGEISTSALDLMISPVAPVAPVLAQ